MDDAGLVRRFERQRDLPRERQRFVERDGPACEALGQVLAVNHFHDDRAQDDL